MESLEILTKNDAETKKVGEILARDILKSKIEKQALIISLEGELGAGKTTFTQGFAKGLGVKETPRSPTFVIMQIYNIPPHRPSLLRRGPATKIHSFTRRGQGRYFNFVHVDAYRLKSKDFKALNWNDFIKEKRNIILVEWGNKIKNILPKNSLRIIFKHIGHSHERLIKIKKQKVGKKKDPPG